MQEVTHADDFLLGQRDCLEGYPHRQGMSDDYDRGYSAQYEFEQVKEYLNVSQTRKQFHTNIGAIR